MINLLPQEYISIQKNKTNKWLAIAVISVEIGVASVLLMQPLGEWQAKRSELDRVKERLEYVQFQQVISVQEELQATKEEYTKWANQIQAVSGTQFISGARLDALVSNVPVGVSIDTLDLDEVTAKIEIKGKATNTFSLTGYVSKLQTMYPEAGFDFDMEEITIDQSYTSFRITIEEGSQDE